MFLILNCVYLERDGKKKGADKNSIGFPNLPFSKYHSIALRKPYFFAFIVIRPMPPTHGRKWGSTPSRRPISRCLSTRDWKILRKYRCQRQKEEKKIDDVSGQKIQCARITLETRKVRQSTGPEAVRTDKIRLLGIEVGRERSQSGSDRAHYHKMIYQMEPKNAFPLFSYPPPFKTFLIIFRFLNNHY